ncbi:hypothetical protein D5R40_31655 [Okeania hirsuta]|uniref:Uncharacterized protein n=1 Tax=Okeania hirsuta TaxID=1458930 RepID=A0A3N6QWG9_9CYAN|nr:hypothetical protein D5R40_31655 [Okeania hirsuta]
MVTSIALLQPRLCGQSTYLDRIEQQDGYGIAEFERPNPKNFSRVLPEEDADVMIKIWSP